MTIIWWAHLISTSSTVQIPTTVVWNTYADKLDGFSISFPSDLIPVPVLPNDNGLYYSTDKINRVYFDFPISDTLASSTGIEGTVSFGSSSQSASACNQFGGKKLMLTNDTYQAPLEKIMVNGTTFDSLHITYGGGDYGEDVFQYSAMHGGTCYRVNLAIYSSDPLEPDTPPDVQDSQYAKAKIILISTFKHMVASIVFNR